MLLAQKTIIVSDEMHEVCPQFVGAAVYAEFVNTPHNTALWEEIDRYLAEYVKSQTVDTIKHIPAIEATRTVYRKCGKDPSRYRPSGEALIRRVLKGKGLYQIDTAVDLINLASIAYGYSIGGFDYDKIEGDRIVLGIGREGEPYEGIGRGMLNIEGLPVYRDALGGIGTPTSDHERTKIDASTCHLLALVNGYDGNADTVMKTAQMIQHLLRTCADSDGGQIATYQ